MNGVFSTSGAQASLQSVPTAVIWDAALAWPVQDPPLNVMASSGALTPLGGNVHLCRPSALQELFRGGAEKRRTGDGGRTTTEHSATGSIHTESDGVHGD